LATLAHSVLVVATAIERTTAPTPAGLIALTVNEFRRLFDALPQSQRICSNALDAHGRASVLTGSA
jgi:hypothetical protein